MFSFEKLKGMNGHGAVSLGKLKGVDGSECSAL